MLTVREMKNFKAIIFPIALMAACASMPLWIDKIESKEQQQGVTLALITLGVFYLVLDILRRRKRGESWNRAFAQGNRLVTGNVWTDALLSFAQLALVILLPFYIIIYVWGP